MKKIVSLLLVLACLAGVLCGCDTVSEIAGNVLAAAGEELKNQVKAKIEEYKVEVVELKQVNGTINDAGGQYQFFCAALVKSNSETSVSECANALKAVFGTAGYCRQTGAQVENEYLVHKTITYSAQEYDADTCYTIYAYVGDLSKVIDLDAIADKLQQATADKN